MQGERSLDEFSLDSLGDQPGLAPGADQSISMAEIGQADAEAPPKAPPGGGEGVAAAEPADAGSAVPDPPVPSGSVSALRVLYNVVFFTAATATLVFVINGALVGGGFYSLYRSAVAGPAIHGITVTGLEDMDARVAVEVGLKSSWLGRLVDVTVQSPAGAQVLLPNFKSSHLREKQPVLLDVRFPTVRLRRGDERLAVSGIRAKLNEEIPLSDLVLWQTANKEAGHVLVRASVKVSTRAFLVPLSYTSQWEVRVPLKGAGGAGGASLVALDGLEFMDDNASERLRCLLTLKVADEVVPPHLSVKIPEFNFSVQQLFDPEYPKEIMQISQLEQCFAQGERQTLGFFFQINKGHREELRSVLSKLKEKDYGFLLGLAGQKPKAEATKLQKWVSTLQISSSVETLMARGGKKIEPDAKEGMTAVERMKHYGLHLASTIREASQTVFGGRARGRPKGPAALNLSQLFDRPDAHADHPVSFGFVGVGGQARLPEFFFKAAFSTDFIWRLSGVNLANVRGRIPKIVLNNLVERETAKTKGFASIEIAHQRTSGHKELVFLITLKLRDREDATRIIQKIFHNRREDTRSMGHALAELKALYVTGSNENILSSLLSVFEMEMELKHGGYMGLKHADRDSQSAEASVSSLDLGVDEGDVRRMYHEAKLELKTSKTAFSLDGVVVLNKKPAVRSNPHVRLYWEDVHVAMRRRLRGTEMVHFDLKAGHVHVKMAALSPGLLVYDGGLKFSLGLASSGQDASAGELELIWVWKEVLNKWYSDAANLGCHLDLKVGGRRLDFEAYVPARKSVHERPRTEEEWTLWTENQLRTNVWFAGVYESGINFLVGLPAIRACSLAREPKLNIKGILKVPACGLNVCVDLKEVQEKKGSLERGLDLRPAMGTKCLFKMGTAKPVTITVEYRDGAVCDLLSSFAEDRRVILSQKHKLQKLMRKTKRRGLTLDSYALTQSRQHLMLANMLPVYVQFLDFDSALNVLPDLWSAEKNQYSISTGYDDPGQYHDESLDLLERFSNGLLTIFKEFFPSLNRGGHGVAPTLVQRIAHGAAAHASVKVESPGRQDAVFKIAMTLPAACFQLPGRWQPSDSDDDDGRARSTMAEMMTFEWNDTEVYLRRNRSYVRFELDEGVLMMSRTAGLLSTAREDVTYGLRVSIHVDDPAFSSASLQTMKNYFVTAFQSTGATGHVARVAALIREMRFQAQLTTKTAPGEAGATHQVEREFTGRFAIWMMHLMLKQMQGGADPHGIEWDYRLVVLPQAHADQPEINVPYLFADNCEDGRLLMQAPADRRLLPFRVRVEALPYYVMHQFAGSLAMLLRHVGLPQHPELVRFTFDLPAMTMYGAVNGIDMAECAIQPFRLQRTMPLLYESPAEGMEGPRIALEDLLKLGKFAEELRSIRPTERDAEELHGIIQEVQAKRQTREENARLLKVLKGVERDIFRAIDDLSQATVHTDKTKALLAFKDVYTASGSTGRKVQALHEAANADAPVEVRGEARWGRQIRDFADIVSPMHFVMETGPVPKITEIPPHTSFSLANSPMTMAFSTAASEATNLFSAMFCLWYGEHPISPMLSTLGKGPSAVIKTTITKLRPEFLELEAMGFSIPFPVPRIHVEVTEPVTIEFVLGLKPDGPVFVRIFVQDEKLVVRQPALDIKLAKVAFDKTGFGRYEVDRFSKDFAAFLGGMVLSRKMDLLIRLTVGHPPEAGGKGLYLVANIPLHMQKRTPDLAFFDSKNSGVDAGQLAWYYFDAMKQTVAAPLQSFYSNTVGRAKAWLQGEPADDGKQLHKRSENPPVPQTQPAASSSWSLGGLAGWARGKAAEATGAVVGRAVQAKDAVVGRAAQAKDAVVGRAAQAKDAVVGKVSDYYNYYSRPTAVPEELSESSDTESSASSDPGPTESSSEEPSERSDTLPVAARRGLTVLLETDEQPRVLPMAGFTKVPKTTEVPKKTKGPLLASMDKVFRKNKGSYEGATDLAAETVVDRTWLGTGAASAPNFFALAHKKGYQEAVSSGVNRPVLMNLYKATFLNTTPFNMAVCGQVLSLYATDTDGLIGPLRAVATPKPPVDGRDPEIEAQLHVLPDACQWATGSEAPTTVDLLRCIHHNVAEPAVSLPAKLPDGTSKSVMAPVTAATRNDLLLLIDEAKAHDGTCIIIRDSFVVVRLDDGAGNCMLLDLVLNMDAMPDHPADDPYGDPCGEAFRLIPTQQLLRWAPELAHEYFGLRTRAGLGQPLVGARVALSELPRCRLSVLWDSSRTEYWVEVEPMDVVIREVLYHAVNVGYHVESRVRMIRVPRRSPDSVLELAIDRTNARIELTEDGHVLHRLVSAGGSEQAELFLDAECRPKEALAAMTTACVSRDFVEDALQGVQWLVQQPFDLRASAVVRVQVQVARDRKEMYGRFGFCWAVVPAGRRPDGLYTAGRTVCVQMDAANQNIYVTNGLEVPAAMEHKPRAGFHADFLATPDRLRTVELLYRPMDPMPVALMFDRSHPGRRYSSMYKVDLPGTLQPGPGEQVYLGFFTDLYAYERLAKTFASAPHLTAHIEVGYVLPDLWSTVVKFVQRDSEGKRSTDVNIAPMESPLPNEPFKLAVRLIDELEKPLQWSPLGVDVELWPIDAANLDRPDPSSIDYSWAREAAGFLPSPGQRAGSPELDAATLDLTAMPRRGRVAAAEITPTRDGFYSVTFCIPAPGRYRVMVAHGRSDARQSRASVLPMGDAAEKRWVPVRNTHVYVRNHYLIPQLV